MNPARMIYEDTPAFIPVPDALQHRKTEVIVWPLDDGGAPASPPAQPTSVTPGKPSAPRPVGLAKDRGVPLPDDFFAPLPADLLAAFSGER